MLKTSVRAEGVEPTLKEPKSFVLTTTYAPSKNSLFSRTRNRIFEIKFKMINCAIKNTDEKLALTADKSLYIKILYNYKQINYLKRPKFNMKQTLFSTVAATGVEPATFTLWGCYATTYTSLRCL